MQVNERLFLIMPSGVGWLSIWFSSPSIHMAAPVIRLDSDETQAVLTLSPPASGLSLQGNIRVPGDKSISHRALMLGALAEGTTEIEGLLVGEDPQSTAKCFRAMGVEISELNSEHVRVQGPGLGNLKEPQEVELQCGRGAPKELARRGAHERCERRVVRG